MKKKYWCSIVCAICIVGTAMTAYAASSASLALQTFQKSAESAAIGLSKKAYAEVWNSSKSTGVLLQKSTRRGPDIRIHANKRINWQKVQIQHL